MIVRADVIGREIGLDQDQVDVVTADHSPVQGIHIVTIREFAKVACETRNGEIALAASGGELLRRTFVAHGAARKDQCSGYALGSNRAGDHTLQRDKGGQGK